MSAGPLERGAGRGLARTLAAGAVLMLMTVSPILRAVSDCETMARGAGAMDPVLAKMEKLGGVLPAAPPGMEAGYITDLEEPGLMKWSNFYLARYTALPVILRRFDPKDRLVLLDMKSQDGVDRFCRAWGYKAVKRGADGAALAEKAN